MLVRISPDVDVNNTTLLLGAIILELNQGHRAQFLVAAGRGRDTIQRVRVRLSRLRKEMERKGKPRKHFDLHASIHPHTEGGVRYDAVIMWRGVTELHQMNQILEGMLDGRSI